MNMVSVPQQYMWLIGEEEESIWIMTDYEIIKDKTSREEEGDRREEAYSLHTISNNAVMNAFAITVKWAEENDMSVSDILVLKRLQNKQKKIYKSVNFFTPME
uniref:Uncharacterized protein n=1 Tax=Homalodisca liturata TaxID=320908 RepID=A0A1B6HY21_9HEMI